MNRSRIIQPIIRFSSLISRIWSSTCMRWSLAITNWSYLVLSSSFRMRIVSAVRSASVFSFSTIIRRRVKFDTRIEQMHERVTCLNVRMRSTLLILCLLHVSQTTRLQVEMFVKDFVFFQDEIRLLFDTLTRKKTRVWSVNLEGFVQVECMHCGRCDRWRRCLWLSSVGRWILVHNRFHLILQLKQLVLTLSEHGLMWFTEESEPYLNRSNVVVFFLQLLIVENKQRGKKFTIELKTFGISWMTSSNKSSHRHTIQIGIGPFVGKPSILRSSFCKRNTELKRRSVYE